MARHHSYSKRSRESRKAMGDEAGDEPDEPDDGAPEGWVTSADEPVPRPDPGS